MKPQGIVFFLPDPNDTREDLDDDYAWHVRQAKAGRPGDRRSAPARRGTWVPRIVAFVRASLPRRGAEAVRRA